jgi:hypothetical protein
MDMIEYTEFVRKNSLCECGHKKDDHITIFGERYQDCLRCTCLEYSPKRNAAGAAESFIRCNPESNRRGGAEKQ